ncbi:MAG: UDP-N-acetylenolpyruvoylglucosamine reductase, partial [Calditrichia bacterium]
NVVVKVVLECQPGDPKAIRREMLEIMRTRREKFPIRLPNCGSVFLSNPETYGTMGPPGKIIEEAGFKGFRIGDAQVSPLHANFIVNMGNARSQDIFALVHCIISKIYERFGICLTCEARYVTDDCRIEPLDRMIKRK